MVITFCCFAHHITGGHRINTQIMNGLVNRQHKVNLVVPEDSFADVYGIDKRVNIVKTNKLLKRPSYPPYFDLISSIFLFTPRIPKSDVLIIDYFLPALSVLLASRIFKKGKCVFISRDIPSIVLHSLLPIVRLFRGGYIFYFKNIFRFFNEQGIVVMSEATNAVLYKLCNKIGTVIPGAIDHKIFHPRTKKTSHTVEALHKKKYILYIKHYEWWKGLEDLIRALDIVYEKDKNIELLVSGRGIKERLNCRCLQRFFSDISDRNLARLYSVCDAFVYPSLYEGFGLCGVEAMACGAPVVLTDSGGVREYAVNGKNCLLVPPKNPELLADAILKVLNDRELNQRLSLEGIRTAYQFTLEKMVDRYEKFLTRLVNEREKSSK